MDKKSIKELRKAIRKENPPVEWIHGFYVNENNSICWSATKKGYAFSEDELSRYTDIAKKSLSGQAGKQLSTISLNSQPPVLLDILNSNEADEDDFLDLHRIILDNYIHAEPYYGVVIKLIYDIPAVANDGAALDDGDGVYRSLLFSICPAKLSAPTLGYLDSKNGVGELTRRWSISNPVEGFLYPDFRDRQADANEVLYRATKEITSSLLNGFFDAEVPMSKEEQNNALSSLLENMNIDLPQATLLHNDFSKIEAETIGKEELKNIFNDCDIDTSNFDTEYENSFGDNDVNVSMMLEKVITIQMDMVSIKASAEMASLIDTKKIDGVYYLTIPVNGKILVNGTETSVK